MDEIIKIFTAGFIRNMTAQNRLSSSTKRGTHKNIDLIVKTNERNIDARNVKRITMIQEEK